MLDDYEYADSDCGPLNRRISLEKLPPYAVEPWLL